MSETVLLVEPDGNGSWKLRTRELHVPINRIIERCHLDPDDPHNEAKQWLRTWVNRGGERDDSGHCRVFREELPPPVEEKEKPMFDELVIKEPLKFGVDGQTFKKMAKKYGKR